MLHCVIFIAEYNSLYSLCFYMDPVGPGSCIRFPGFAFLLRNGNEVGRRMLLRYLFIGAFGLCSTLVFSADSFSVFDDPHNLNNPYFNKLHHKYRDTQARPVTVKKLVPEEKPQEEREARTRSHQEGILEMSGTSVAPFRVNVKVGPVGVVGNVELTRRSETLSRWFFRAENIPEDQNIWDAKGRAVLVPGEVSCQVSHREALTDYHQAGLVLGMEAKMPGLDLLKVGLEGGTNVERLRSEYFEGEDICSLGEVPAYTTQGDIERRCKICLGRVLKTIKQDIESRLSFLNYYVQTPLCKNDSDCYREDSDWLVGRCVLVKDKNKSHYTECRARSSIGAACAGPGSRGLFEFKCDKGLECVQTFKGVLSPNKYECRNPKQPQFTGPIALRDRAAYALTNNQLDLFEIALEKYFKTHGRYPSTQQGLGALVSQQGESLLANPMNFNGRKEPPRDPFSGAFGKFLYISDGKGYRLVSVGPDGKANTSDDLIIKK